MEPEHIESLYPANTREKEFGEIFSFVKAGKSAQLIGMPGVGRTNILGFLSYNRNIRIRHTSEIDQTLYHFVLINFSEIKNRNLFDAIKFMFLELTSSLHERRREEEFLLIDKMFKDALSYQDELVLFQSLKDAVELLTLEKGLFVTFLFDRFEAYIPQLTSDFFTNLRSLRSRAKYKFSVVFSTTRPLEETLDPEILADFYEYIAENHIYVSLKDDAGLSFRIAHLEKLTDKTLSQKTIDELLALTAGHSKLTRLGLEALLANPYVIASKAKQSNTDRDEIAASTSSPRNDNMKVFLLSLKTIQGALKEIWHYLTPDEQQDIVHICRGGSCPSPNHFLQKIHLLEKDSITIPLFADFAKEEMKKEKKEQLFAYDSTINTIVRGTQTVSDQLTLSEFRLFKLLLEKQNTVIDREEIIGAVWSDSKTQAGVSEQAVDQLIFRLRKKIEDDPTRPTHIQTVKGRGVKFVQ